MNTIKVTGVFDNSGYGVANKATAMALIDAGIEISTEVVKISMSRLEFASDEDLAKILKLHTLKKAKINIVQLIPLLWSQYFHKNCYNIGYFFWESDKLSDDWINIINNGLCNEVWVTCQSNYDALMNSGIKKPVYIVPQYTKLVIMDKEKAKELLPIPKDNVYKFYSIFQWTQRKNPESLFEAYFNEFSGKEKVMLVAKTYGPSPFSDRRWIKEKILDIKEKAGSKAPLYLFGELLTTEQVNAIHPQCDCYVYSGRAEGWNIPLLESIAYKKQIVTTKTGGIADWITDESAYIIPHTSVPINAAGQAWGRFYHSEPPQKWGDVKIKDVQKAMRGAYNERKDYSHRINHYDKILEVSSKETFVKTIRQRLSEIV